MRESHPRMLPRDLDLKAQMQEAEWKEMGRRDGTYVPTLYGCW